ncbi:HAMP domain-containing sensor histidine kinase [Sphingobacterium sp. UT-1RO-CII-1]|uniref:sensor histidine kinase n=1 Tax=Sphingobacterium sp. UT-1RO-CII-1 TaxID=2995225 RepID=UPI00227CA5B9|nr:HAMP domain-containing sensor histidine kinase [Sphingobacterium sp. UT-1RO-CII-1]MCY4781479.1 HAMP domain-containing sensor histidine kinase [Sphingobacterium sp. UT-1RO-CII-1]
MKLQQRLSLYSVVIFTMITVGFSVVIYFSYQRQMISKEQKSLSSKALLIAIYYLEQDELSLAEHSQIKRQVEREISMSDVVLIDSLNELVRGNMRSVTALSENFVERVRKEGSAFLNSDNNFYYGIYYEDNQGDFVVISRESKEEFNEQMQSLLQVLLGAFLFGVVVIYLFSNYLGRFAYRPIVDVIQQIGKRDSRNFNQPLSISNAYAEIQDLVKTYNHFVDRIAETFKVQKNFIDYVSHELRTPIAALLGTLEVTQNKERSEKEYKEVIVLLKGYAFDLQEALEQMMLLSGAKTSFDFERIRIDEIIWQLVEDMTIYHQAQIEVNLQVDDPTYLELEGNDKLLELALRNLLSNAVKYSDNQLVKIELTVENSKLELSIQDKGIGILAEDIPQITQNFYRGTNASNYQGKGVGLSIANIIFNMHQVKMSIYSGNQGTNITLRF